MPIVTSAGARARGDVVVVGAGWLGSALADGLAADGYSVWVMRRTVGAGVVPAPAEVHRVTGDIAAPLDAGLLAQLPGSLAAVVLCTAPSATRGESHADSYPAAARGAVALARRMGAGLLLYTSSTGVYGATDGRVVDETTAVASGDSRVDALVAAERTIVEAGTVGSGLCTGVLRVAGLYGPGRDPAARFRGDGVQALLATGDWWTNFAWRDDVVRAVQHLLAHPEWLAPSSAGGAVFNCADGHPVRASQIAAALGGRPSTAVLDAAPSAGRPSGRSNQRVMTHALQGTGWRPTMPTVFDGLRALGHTVAEGGPRPEGVPAAPAPYGPQTAAVRRLLLHLAQLGTTPRAQIVAAYRAVDGSAAWHAAETHLADAIARGGRADAQGAVAGPFLQLMRVNDGDTMDPVAEPALAAVLALVAADLLTPEDVAVLTGPVATVVPLDVPR